MPDLPKVGDYNVVKRFRSLYGVTYRTVNLRYKISHAKRKHRLKVFWCNSTRARTLHKLCFPDRELKLIGFDQKPFYFNSSLAAKTLDLRGRIELL